MLLLAIEKAHPVQKQLQEKMHMKLGLVEKWVAANLPIYFFHFFHRIFVIWLHLIMVFKKRSINHKKQVLYFLARQSFPDKAVIGRAYNSITLNEMAYMSK